LEAARRQVSVRIMVAIGQAGIAAIVALGLPISFGNSETFNQIDGVKSTIHQALIDAAVKREASPELVWSPTRRRCVAPPSPQRAGG
jgi:hypothetical protein